MIFDAVDLGACAVIALAVAAISMSFTQGTMFEPLRQWIAARNALLGELARCFFCLSHWIAFAGVAVYRPRPMQFWAPLDFAVAAFVVIALATVMAGLMFASFRTAMQTHMLRAQMLEKGAQQRP
jgi:hypothetical protein